MKGRSPNQEEFDLGLLREEENQLRQRQKQLADSSKKLATERSDLAVTLPPSELIQLIEKRKSHEELASKRQERDIRHEHSRGVLLILALAAATAALVWWGLSLMRGA
jgi:hypothetical protein